MFSSLGSDLCHALRSAKGRPLLGVVVIVTLAVGIGANTAIFSLVHAALLKPLPYRDPGRLVYAQCTFGGQPNPMASAPDYYDYREQADDFEALSAFTSFVIGANLTGGERPERVNVVFVSDDLFRTLGVSPMAGRWFSGEEGKPGGPPVAMISEQLARRWFGDAQAAVGRPLAVYDQPITAVGVMPASFRFLHDADVWLPMRRGENVAAAARRFHNWLIVGRLKPGVSLEAAQRQVDVISKRLQQQYPDSNRNKALRLDPLQAGMTAAQRPRLLLLVGAVGLLLLIACANVAGLLLARGAVRQSEMAVRAAMGATRGRLVRLLMTESLTMALAGGLLGCLLAVWLQRLLPALTGLERQGVTLRRLDWPVLLFALGLSLATGLVFGIVPALRSSSLRLSEQLAPGVRTTGGRGGVRLRSVLVAGQVALSLVLLAGAGLLIRSFVRLSAADLGYRIENVLAGDVALSPTRYRTPAERIRFFEGLASDLAALPGVRAVGFTSHIPIRHKYGNIPSWAADNPPADPADRPLAHRRVVLPGYFDAMGMTVLQGRGIRDGDREGAPNALVINQLMVRTLFPDRDPVGHQVMVDMGDEQPVPFTVVGVIADARLDAVASPARPSMYMSYYQFPAGALRFVLRTATPPDSITEMVRRVVRARDHDVPVEALVPLASLVSESVATQRVLTTTIILFATVAMLLAAIGLYGVLAYLVSQRTHEIGVRMSLGATAGAVVRHVLGRAVLIVAVGLAVGLAGAFAATRLATQVLYEVTPTDPLSFAAATASLALVACGVALGPALRAARIDPVRALRNE